MYKTSSSQFFQADHKSPRGHNSLDSSEPKRRVPRTSRIRQDDQINNDLGGIVSPEKHFQPNPRPTMINDDQIRLVDTNVNKTKVYIN